MSLRSARISLHAHSELLRLQEVIIPFLRDSRMPADLLCLIFEDDFRFWPEGDDLDDADDYKIRAQDIAKRQRRSVGRNRIGWGPKGEPTAPSTEEKGGSSSAGAYRPDAKGREEGNR